MLPWERHLLSSMFRERQGVSSCDSLVRTRYALVRRFCTSLLISYQPKLVYMFFLKQFLGSQECHVRSAQCSSTRHESRGDGITLIQNNLSLELGVTVSPDVQETSHTGTWIRILLGRREREMQREGCLAGNQQGPLFPPSLSSTLYLKGHFTVAFTKLP